MTPRRRVAIVGAGLMGRWHSYACRAAGGEVTYVVDPNVDAGRRLARRVGARAVESLDDVAADSAVDIVHVCTPVATHERAAHDAIQRGCGVIVEKPMGETLAVVERLLGAARAGGVWIQPVHQLVYQDGIARAHGWLRTAGPLRLVDYRVCSAGTETTGIDPGALVADVLPHPLSLIAVLAPGALSAARWHVDTAGEGELSAVARSSDAIVRLSVSTHGRPPRHEITLVADKGTLTADLFHGFAYVEPGGTSRQAKALRPFTSAARRMTRAGANLAGRAARREPAYPGLTTLLTRIYDADVAHTPLPFDDEHMRSVARARDQILDAADLARTS